MSTLKPPLGPSDHVLGTPNARVELVEFGDFECPHCGAAHEMLKQVLRHVGRELLLGFRNFPLSEVHPRAFLAAEAAEAAGAQGKYWPMHDMLFENQQALDPEDLLAYAKHLRLDVARFAEDVSRNAYAGKVKSDFSSGVRSGVNGTPTFFVDGARYDLNLDADTLTTALRAVIRAKEVT